MGIGEALAFVTAALLLWALVTPRRESQYTGFYLEPMGSHDTDPFEDGTHKED